ncbi:MAG: gamma-glutamyl-gamma-aminobutyrate hydrolase family protein [Anaerolineae bacterium]|nr:gamma-glutamyl-gamma-aminobutyrate hydrolase family protein [Anaerolineae bacterium]
MRIHALQHVPFENIGSIADWADRKGHPVTTTHLYAGDPLPVLDTFDWLIVMGGPMGVYDEDRYPWIGNEKAFLRAVLKTDKPVLGICLGAQFIADALGAKVYKNAQREIGWFPITFTGAAGESPLFDSSPPKLIAYHWHDDTYDLPAGAVHIARSEACENQAFVHSDRVVALQFHLEVKAENVHALITHCADEIGFGPHMQPADAMLAHLDLIPAMNRTMFDLLDRIEKQTQ